MSQFPPPPPPPGYPQGYGPPPPGYGAPPPGYPVPGQTPGNGYAITSLVCGILGCIPFLTGLLAMLFGVVGIRKSNRVPYAGGKGMAIAGLVLGLISLLFWGGIAWLFTGSAPQRETARSFVKAVSAGDVATAQSLCT